MQQAPATPSRASSYRPNDPPSSSAAQNSNSATALKGATLAFQAQKKDAVKAPANAADSKPTPRTPNPTVRDNGALLAATQASRDHPTPRSRSPTSATKGRAGVSRQVTGGSTQEMGHSGRELETGAVAQRLSQFLGSSPAASSPYHLWPNNGKGGPDPRSASFIAATLAASRTGSPAPPTQTFAQAPLSQTQRHARIPRRSSVSNSPNSSSASLDEKPDATSIAPMGSLISMFETRRQDTDPVKKGDTTAGATGRNGLGTPPKMRTITPPREMSPMRGGTQDTAASEEADFKASQGGARKPNPRPKPRSILRFEGAVADSPEIGRAVTSEITSKNKDGAPTRASEKPIPKPKPMLSETSAIPSSPKRSTGQDATDWPLNTTQTAAPKLKSQAKGPPVAPRMSTRQTAPQVESRTHDESKGLVQKVAQATSSRPNPQPPSKPKPPAPTQGRPVTPQEVVRRAPTELHSPQPKRIIPNSMLEHPVLRPRASSVKSKTTVAVVSEPQVLDKARDQKTEPGTIQSLELLHRPTSRDSNSSNDTFVSASSTQSPRAGSPVRGREFDTQDHQLRRLSDSVHAQLRPPMLARSSSISAASTGSPNRIFRSSTAALPPNSTSNLALDSLTSAMMASNLAASRSASNTPSRNSPVPPPPRRHNQRRSPLHPSHTGGSPNGGKSGASGAKSPGRMLQTLRAPASLSDDEDARRRIDRHRKKPLRGSKKHAHHEGSRRRWRDEVTAKERRRYEALWASNRGLFLDRAQLELFAACHKAPRVADLEVEPNDLVANVVVRDIWSRSRLPVDELAEVWDLVDRGQVGALRRHEFVVGMWLIDQRLRGRKIPATVGESVWASARDMRFAGPGKPGKKR